MRILGVDLGNYSTKTSEGVIFDSRVAAGHKELNRNDIKVVYKDKKFTVGTGSLELGKDRIYSNLYDLCLLTSIAQGYPGLQNIEVNIVMGLPPLDYESGLKSKLEEKLNKLGTQKILIDGKTISITINKALIFSESAIVFGNPNQYRDNKTLVIDIGGGSTDMSQFKGLDLVKNTTTKLGMLRLCEDMKQIFNSTEQVSLTEDDMEDLINKDTTIVRGDKKDITYLKDVIENHVTNICNTINQNFDTESTDIILIGGGAKKLINYFKKRYKNAKVADNNQLVNAKTYAAVGEMLWSE
jgi:plasmid segregation protein ParM